MLFMCHFRIAQPAGSCQIGRHDRREEAASKMGFSAYGVTQSDDPLAQALRGLIDSASTQEHQIALLWQAIEKLAATPASSQSPDCVPVDAARQEHFEADKLNALVGK